jgi:hypothetical protein
VHATPRALLLRVTCRDALPCDIVASARARGVTLEYTRSRRPSIPAVAIVRPRSPDSAQTARPSATAGPPTTERPCGLEHRRRADVRARPGRVQSGYSSLRQVRGSSGWAFGVRSSREL